MYYTFNPHVFLFLKLTAFQKQKEFQTNTHLSEKKQNLTFFLYRSLPDIKPFPYGLLEIATTKSFNLTTLLYKVSLCL